MHLSAHPLERFLDVLAALMEEKSWSEDSSALRYAASALATSDGSPRAVASDVRQAAEQLKERAGWFGALNSSIRFAVAAMLLRNKDQPDAFCDDVERVGELFREEGLHRGPTYEALAILVLRGANPGGIVSRATVRRFRRVYDEMRRHHRWLTGADDYPCCALLTLGEEEPVVIGQRVERFYEGLRDRGFRRSNALQTVSHILFFNPFPDETCLRRFRGLFDAFDEAGLWMHTGDYDEVACLTFLEQDKQTIVRRTLAHRKRIEAAAPYISNDVSFSLACSTAFLDLVQLDRDRLHSVHAALQVQAILQAQQVAMLGAAGAGAAAAAS